MERMGRNGKMENMNSNKVGRVEIKFLEKTGVTGRGAFYDHVGALNDVCQNHVLHMLGTVLASPYAKLKNYASLRAFAVSSLKLSSKANEKPVLAQYSSFKKEDGVSPKSNTETFFRTENVLSFPASKQASGSSSFNSLSKDEKDLAKRWHGLKVSLCGGKGMSEDLVDICFHGTKEKSAGGAEKVTSVCIVTSKYGAKDAFQTIIEAALVGDISLSIPIRQVIAGWKYVENVKKQKTKVRVYEIGAEAKSI